MRRCIADYNMIAPQDAVAVGLSGGKDSIFCLVALAKLRHILPGGFTLEAITLDLGFPGVDLSPVTDYCRSVGVRHTVIKTHIAEIVFDIRRETHPCSLCAKMRRGALHRAAIELGCRKVALGHHLDDAVETFWLSLMYEGRLSCFAPVTQLDKAGITLLRPMLYVPEWQCRVMAASGELPIIENPCPANGRTKRQEAKEALAAIQIQRPGIKRAILRAMQSLPLPGWERPADGKA